MFADDHQGDDPLHTSVPTLCLHPYDFSPTHRSTPESSPSKAKFLEKSLYFLTYAEKEMVQFGP